MINLLKKKDPPWSASVSGLVGTVNKIISYNRYKYQYFRGLFNSISFKTDKLAVNEPAFGKLLVELRFHRHAFH